VSCFPFSLLPHSIPHRRMCITSLPPSSSPRLSPEHCQWHRKFAAAATPSAMPQGATPLSSLLPIAPIPYLPHVSPVLQVLLATADDSRSASTAYVAPHRQPTFRVSPTDHHLARCHLGVLLVLAGHTLPPASRHSAAGECATTPSLVQTERGDRATSVPGARTLSPLPRGASSAGLCRQAKVVGHSGAQHCVPGF
jgi:hypothetical protein